MLRLNIPRRADIGSGIRAAGIRARVLAGSLYHRWELNRAPAHQIGGVEIRIEPEISIESGLLLARLERVLDLICRTDEARYHAIRTQFSCILVKRGPGAQYWPDHRVCVLEPNIIVSRSKAIVALSVVHELAHARIARRVPLHLHISDPRFERLCIRSQITFARRLANAGWEMDDVVSHYEALLYGPMPKKGR